LLRVATAIVVVAAVTAILVAADADLAFAAVVFLLVVAGASVFGYATGLIAATSSAVALTYYFTRPVHSFQITEPDNLLALVAFVTVSLLVGATIARLNELRTRAEVHAREASLRVTLAHELRRGIDVEIVLRRLAAELESLFDLASCGATVANGELPAAAPGDILVETPPLVIWLTPTRPLQTDELAMVRGLASAVANAFELERLDAAAREQRVRSELDRSRAGLLTAITHDLRTPLATIKTASGVLLKSGARLDESERHALLADTYAEAARLERLVDKVLEMGRIRSGALQPDLLPTAPIDLVHAATARRGRGLDAERVALDLDDELPAVDVDVLLMEHVLVNLLENAALHGGSDRAIEVRGATDGQWVTLSIVDHGAGIPAGDRARVFEEFVRRGAPTDGTGTGLGLTIVHALVGAQSGRVWCEETPGGGATFVVQLPVSCEGRTP
jgi:two-component system sensor histidine kinase KdpD